MSFILDDGKVLGFGHKQEDVERLYACQATEHPMPLARRPSEKFLSLDAARLDFDRGLLKRVTFEANYQFKNPLTPYPDPWKNFTAIESRRIYGQMPRDEFLLYVEAWKERAVALGAEQAGLDDLRDGQFAVAVHQDEFADMASINFGPIRKTSRGGIWCDGWVAMFTTGQDQGGPVIPTLESLSAFRDEFNSAARGQASPGLSSAS